MESPTIRNRRSHNNYNVNDQQSIDVDLFDIQIEIERGQRRVPHIDIETTPEIERPEIVTQFTQPQRIIDDIEQSSMASMVSNVLVRQHQRQQTERNLEDQLPQQSVTLSQQSSTSSSTSTSSTLEALTVAQRLFEQRFNCIVCMDAKLEMVYGICQHRVCADCLYGADHVIRASMEKCPMCATPSFPYFRPDIPDDNIEAQRRLGVQECPNKPCTFQTWSWEMDDHAKECLHLQKATPLKQKGLKRPKSNVVRRSSIKKTKKSTSNSSSPPVRRSIRTRNT